MSQSLNDIKAFYLNKFHVVAEGENIIPNLQHNPQNSYNDMHVDFANVLLKVGLSDLQTGIFRTILDDVCVATKIKEHASLSETPAQNENYSEEYENVQEELLFLVKMLENMDIKDLTFAGANENGWLSFAEKFYDDMQRCNSHIGHTFFADMPTYYGLVTRFLNGYLKCVNAFHIMLYKKAEVLATIGVNNINSEDEEAIFYIETHNFFMEILRRFSFLNYNYNKMADIFLIKEIEFYTHLLELLAVIFDETITDGQKQDFTQLIQASSIAYLNFGSYFRKWLYKKAASYEENISR